jgi:adenine phosphoribosyltransferase
MNRRHPILTTLIDVNTEGPRYDVTPLFADFESFSALVEDLLAQFNTIEFDYVAGIDALGFILGTALSFRALKGFIPIRKGGKLPVETLSVDFVDYSGQEKSLEMRVDAIKPGARVLLVDEWIETGAQVNAAIELIESLKGIVIGVATINIDENKETEKLKKKYKCYAVWADNEED